MNRALIVMAIGMFLLAIATEAIIQSFTNETTTAKFYAMGVADDVAPAPSQNQ